jgi:FAD/FMN-containing dehydrogenase
MDALSKLVKTFDPDGIMNPGKLIGERKIA